MKLVCRPLGSVKFVTIWRKEIRPSTKPNLIKLEISLFDHHSSIPVEQTKTVQDGHRQEIQNICVRQCNHQNHLSCTTETKFWLPTQQPFSHASIARKRFSSAKTEQCCSVPILQLQFSKRQKLKEHSSKNFYRNRW